MDFLQTLTGSATVLQDHHPPGPCLFQSLPLTWVLANSGESLSKLLLLVAQRAPNWDPSLDFLILPHNLS